MLQAIWLTESLIYPVLDLLLRYKPIGRAADCDLMGGENLRPVQRIKRLYEIERWFRRHLKEENHD